MRMQGWKASVKARHFVFALHDYFAEKYRDMNPLQAFLASTTLRSSEDFRIAQNLANKKADDQWALNYINMQNIQPILEAFDDDGSGFVTIREVNQLTSARPKGWRYAQQMSIVHFHSS
jgi:hypothetical protein